MANAKATPRQKMINLIYLVLTAILALNVSAEVLDAFKTVNDGISSSNTSLHSKNTEIYSEFDQQLLNDPVKAREAYQKAQLAKGLSLKLYTLIEQYKKQMIGEAGGYDNATGKIKHDDNVEIATRIFVEDGGKKGKELKAEIENTRSELLKLLNGDQRAEAESSLPLKTHSAARGQSWEYARFNQVPVVAAVTLLSKYQNDLLSSESHIIESIYNTINHNIKNVDRMEAKVISPSSYVLQGEPYKADVMVAAYSSTQHPDVFLGQFEASVKKDASGAYQPIISASDVPPLTRPVKLDVLNGFGKIEMAGNETGKKTYTGVMRVKGQNGGYEFYPFEGEYQVAPKVAVVSPEKMNVLYIGLDNPVDISVPGVAQSDVIAAFDGDGTLVKEPDGSFKALVTTPGNTKVKVNAKINGRVMPVGEQKFRIKRVPNPVTTVDGISSGGNSTATFVKGRKGIVPKSDEFPYGEMTWLVKTAEVVVRKGQDVFKVEITGPLFNQQVKDLFKGLKKGDAVFIDYIKVLGPDKKIREIAPLAFNITAL